MTKQLYIKTDGPIPEGCDYITAGKVYEAYDICMERHFCSAISDTGSMLRIDLKRGCPCELCQLKWHFCDQHGNPVPAPWESTKRPKLRGEEGDLCACHDSPEWNVASWKIAICEHPEYSEKDGLCLRCDHARKCHEEGFYSPQESINYRAHAEALAELLTIARCPDASCDNNGTTVHETVSTTIGCCGIYLPDGQCCGNGVPEAVQDIEPAPCQWCHERTKALAAFDQDRGRVK